ncbi:MAG TPA: hypothetical protein VGL98_07600 [Gammaproteobacteria bacterium]
MIRRLRTFLISLLLVPALFSNASAFTTEGEGALNLARPKAGVCWVEFGGIWYWYAC